MGKGVLKAVANINDIIGPAVVVRGVVALRRPAPLLTPLTANSCRAG
jgi:enolase